MASRQYERFDLFGHAVVGVLRSADAGCRFECCTDNEFVAVRQASGDAARVVGRRVTCGIDNGIIVFRAAHLRSGQ